MIKKYLVLCFGKGFQNNRGYGNEPVKSFVFNYKFFDHLIHRKKNRVFGPKIGQISKYPTPIKGKKQIHRGIVLCPTSDLSAYNPIVPPPPLKAYLIEPFGDREIYQMDILMIWTNLGYFYGLPNIQGQKIYPIPFVCEGKGIVVF